MERRKNGYVGLSHKALKRNLVALGAALACSSFGETAYAETPDQAEARTPADAAGEAFDLGVHHFEGHDYVAAANAFLHADALKPNPDALSNALTAAKKSRDHLLTVEVARRALTRAGESPGLESAAREAIAESGPHLAHLDLSCPKKCALFIDGEETSGENLWLNPGSHRISARWSSDRSSTKSVNLAEGANYSFALEPPGEQQPRPEQVSAPIRDRKPAPVTWTDEALFAVGAAATVGLAAATVWSGFDATQAKSGLSAAPTEEELNPVRKKVQRTDILLGTSIGVCALTAVWAIWGVDFRTKSPAVTAVLGSDYWGVGYGGAF